MKRKIVIALGCIMLTMAAACASNTGANLASTPTPCASSDTVLSGQTTSATTMPNQPTFSPEFQATAEARLMHANPGNPPYPSTGQVTSQLPPCPTNTPLPTSHPKTSQGGMAQSLIAPNQPALSSNKLATTNGRMRSANLGAPTMPD